MNSPRARTALARSSCGAAPTSRSRSCTSINESKDLTKRMDVFDGDSNSSLESASETEPSDTASSGRCKSGIKSARSPPAALPMRGVAPAQQNRQAQTGNRPAIMQWYQHGPSNELPPILARERRRRSAGLTSRAIVKVLPTGAAHSTAQHSTALVKQGTLCSTAWQNGVPQATSCTRSQEGTPTGDTGRSMGESCTGSASATAANGVRFSRAALPAPLPVPGDAPQLGDSLSAAGRTDCTDVRSRVSPTPKWASLLRPHA